MIENIFKFVKRETMESVDTLWDYPLSDLKSLREELKKDLGSLGEKELKIVDETIDDKEKRKAKEIETEECSNCGVGIKDNIIGEQEGLMYYEISFEGSIKFIPIRFSEYPPEISIRCKNCQRLFDFSKEELLKIVSKE